MWINRHKYIDLEKQISSLRATVQWLQQDCNRLNRENAVLKGKVLGLPPIDVPQVEITMPEAPGSKTTDHNDEDQRPSFKDLVAGNISFEDMGDDAADAAGVGWDPSTGQVRYS